MTAEQKRLLLNFFRSIFDDYNSNHAYKIDDDIIDELMEIFCSKVMKMC